jgi:hypothetical protein
MPKIVSLTTTLRQGDNLLRKIELERKIQWLHRQSPLWPFAINAPEKGDKAHAEPPNSPVTPLPAIFWTQPSSNQYFREIDAS